MKRPGRLAAAALAAVLLALAGSAPAGAGHGDVHATCENGRPQVTEQPAGTEHVVVTCVRGQPEFMVRPAPVPTFNPVTQSRPMPVPPDFGGWVTVWLNERPLKTPYDPVRGIQEPGAFVSASSNRVMMPVRFFTAAFGGGVGWNDEGRWARLFLKDKVVQIWAEQTQAHINFRLVTLDQRALLFNGRVFVPVRFLMEAFGAEVEWDHFNRSVRITLDGAQCVHPVYCGEAR